MSIRWRAFPQILYAARRSAGRLAKEIDNHGLAMRKFDSVASATVWAQSGLV